jgi:thymidylate synthase (FAD)
VQVKPEVILISHTSNPDLVVASAARLCYSPDSIEEVMDNFTEEKIESFVAKLESLHHESPFEHVSFTFGISGVSRALSHQLVRHRLASYSQKSQRYVNESSFDYIIPPSIEKNEEALKTYTSAMLMLDAVYKNLVKENIPAEDARFVLPNACETQLIMTMNIRELWNFFKHRCCNRAQWEIRIIAHRMLQLAKETSPLLFAHAGSSCEVLGYCPENSMQCEQRKALYPTLESLNLRR